MQYRNYLGLGWKHHHCPPGWSLLAQKNAGVIRWLHWLYCLSMLCRNYLMGLGSKVSSLSLVVAASTVCGLSRLGIIQSLSCWRWHGGLNSGHGRVGGGGLCLRWWCLMVVWSWAYCVKSSLYCCLLLVLLPHWGNCLCPIEGHGTH